MKTLTRTAARNERTFRFIFNRNIRATEDSKSLQTWEEENPEYASWNLVSDEQESATCWFEKPLPGLFLWSLLFKNWLEKLNKGVSYTQITDQRYWSPPGKVKGRQLLRNYITGAAPSGTSCSFTFSLRSKQTFTLDRIRPAQYGSPEI